MNKKTYIQPRMDWEKILISQSLLTESLDVNDDESDEDVEEFDDLLGKSRWEEDPKEALNLW